MRHVSQIALQKLAAANTQLADAARRKDEFLATLAHELRNPLAAICNSLELTQRATNDFVVIEQARAVMDRQLRQLVRLIDDLMDVSRINQGKIMLRRKPVQLANVIHSAVESSRPLIEQMGHELSIALPKVPIVVDADLTRLAQVFVNLLTNAAKYTLPGGQIWLAAERQGRNVVVSVRDSGIGIPAEHFSHIFEMFSQIHLEQSQGGLGIGLTLVKRLVEMHGGEIDVKSEGVGKGAEFVVRLPLVAEEPFEQSPNDKLLPDFKTSLRILVVDDNRDGADIFAMLLKGMGNETRTVYDGEEAISAAETFLPEVILLDLGLPTINGYDVCRRIRGQPWGKKMIIIARTGWGQDEDRQRTQEAGFDHHMVKPVDVELMKILKGVARLIELITTNDIQSLLGLRQPLFASSSRPQNPTW